MVAGGGGGVSGGSATGDTGTNMAKATVNMLTRTSAREMFKTHGILMTSVDTNWITDERPKKMRLAEEGLHAPLDLVDGAARVYDPSGAFVGSKALHQGIHVEVVRGVLPMLPVGLFPPFVNVVHELRRILVPRN